MFKNDFVTYEVLKSDERFPERLEKLKDCPTLLHVAGEIPRGPSVAIVGARKAEPWAKRFAYGLAQDLSRQGIVIVSGGALGIDTEAHLGALEAGGVTVAVIGSGFDHISPVSNREMFKDIAVHGAVLSEFAHPVPPTKWTFPKRNRIVAGLSDALVVVQAAAKSGALITASMAQKLGVPAGAVPGSPADRQSKGANGLIRKGFSVVENADDVMSLLSGTIKNAQLNLPICKSKGKDFPLGVPSGLNEDETKLLKMLSEQPVHIDDIAFALSMDIGRLSATLVALEISGLVEDLGGKNFIRLG